MPCPCWNFLAKQSCTFSSQLGALAPCRGDQDKWFILIICTLHWIGKEGQALFTQLYYSREGFVPRKGPKCILAVGQVWICLFGLWVLFLFLFFFYQWKKPIYSNFLQLHNEVPFSDVQYLKVRESLAAIKQWLMLLQSVWAQEFTPSTPSPSPGAGRSCCGALEQFSSWLCLSRNCHHCDTALKFKICCALGGYVWHACLISD